MNTDARAGAAAYYRAAGRDMEQDLAALKEIKEVKRARLSEYKAYRPNAEYHEGKGVWSVKVDIALPCATQNELLLADAEALVKSLGGTTKSSVVKDLSYLVTNDTSSGSSKNRKAQELGIPVIDEKTFLSLAGK